MEKINEILARVSRKVKEKADSTDYEELENSDEWHNFYSDVANIFGFLFSYQEKDLSDHRFGIQCQKI